MSDVPSGPALYAFGLASFLQAFDPAAAGDAAAPDMDLVQRPPLLERKQPVLEKDEKDKSCFRALRSAPQALAHAVARG